MGMVRGAYVKYVDLVAELADHFAIITEFDGIGMFAHGNVKTPRIDIASRNYVSMHSQGVKITFAFSAYADARNLKSFVCSEDSGRKKREGKGSGCGCPEKRPA
jgi:hypothetical protein